jgi:uncharacterized protein YoaH (UPF0181 family)
MRLSMRIDELCANGLPAGMAIAQAIAEATESRERVERERWARR